MSRRGAVLLAVVGALVLLGWLYLRDTDDPLPSDEVALAVAREDWDRYCDDYDAEWPCVVVTRIEMAIPAGPRKVAKGTMGYCFDIKFHAETSRWNEANGIPNEPRSYILPYAPTEQCATFEYDGVGDKADVSSWSIYLTGTPWYEPWLKEMYETLR